jgi:hypothetical protein
MPERPIPLRLGIWAESTWIYRLVTFPARRPIFWRRVIVNERLLVACAAPQPSEESWRSVCAASGW